MIIGVCNYGPAGNFNQPGFFTSNVLPTGTAVNAATAATEAAKTAEAATVKVTDHGGHGAYRTPDGTRVFSSGGVTHPVLYY